MTENYPNLFSPIQIGNVVFRNRIFAAPNGNSMQGDENHPALPSITYYANKAKGGAACVICGTCVADKMMMPPYVPPTRIWNRYNIFDPINFRYFTQQADAIHRYGAKASMELIVGANGGYSRENLKLRPYYMPSETEMPDGTVLPQMPVEEMERLAECYAEAAERLSVAKYDAVLIHGGHGMFLEQFISPRYNRRTDEFGGSMENRARFPLMVLDAIRKRVGRNLLIEYRISGCEYSEGGLTVDETIEFVKLIEDRIDLIHVSGGDVSDKKTRPIMHPSGFIEETPFRKWQRAVKHSGVKVPVVAVGGIHTPDTAEDILSSGDADIVTTARGFIADPEFPHKARDGRAEDITPCVRCFNCLDDHKDSGYYSCTVNPTVGRMHYLTGWGDGCTPTPQKVVIIGGGPGGMETAIIAADHGHEVILMEKGKELGGALRFADRVQFKTHLKDFKDHLVLQVKKRDNIKVLLQTEASPLLVAGVKPDAVIAALGSAPIIPAIPGIGKSCVMSAPEVFSAPEKVGGRVVIIGGGQVGCETALHLAQQGRDVTLVEMKSKLAEDAMLTYRIHLMEFLERQVTVITEGTCKEVGENQVVYTGRDGTAHSLPADTVVISAGMKGQTAQAVQFCKCASYFRMVGDCVKSRNVKWAVREGYDAAMEIGHSF